MPDLFSVLLSSYRMTRAIWCVEGRTHRLHEDSFCEIAALRRFSGEVLKLPVANMAAFIPILL